MARSSARQGSRPGSSWGPAALVVHNFILLPDRVHCRDTISPSPSSIHHGGSRAKRAPRPAAPAISQLGDCLPVEALCIQTLPMLGPPAVRTNSAWRDPASPQHGYPGQYTQIPPFRGWPTESTDPGDSVIWPPTLSMTVIAASQQASPGHLDLTCPHHPPLLDSRGWIKHGPFRRHTSE